MNKTAFIFPGQGAQYVGMGKGFYDRVDHVKQIYEIASEKTGLNVQELCFEENDKIDQTEFTQIAILTTEIALLEMVKERGIRPDICAGLSLGEYGALAASGALRIEDAFQLVRKRGIYMQNACPTGGAMLAVIGGDVEQIEKICLECGRIGVIQIANYNCPGQVVVSGKQEAVKKAAELLIETGVRKCVLLNCSGPFHTKLLQEAGRKLEKDLDSVTVQDILIPYVSNTLAEIIEDKNQVKELLIRQISEPVRWEQSVSKMLEIGVDTFVEIGPGRTLANFIRRIDRNVKVVNIDTYETFESAIDKIS